MEAITTALLALNTVAPVEAARNARRVQTMLSRPMQGKPVRESESSEAGERLGRLTDWWMP